MGRSESDWKKCRKHPKHKNSTGVCPYCLKERLVHLASPSFSSILNLGCSTSASSTPYYSSDSDLSSPAESPTDDRLQKAKLSLLLRDDIQLGDELPTKRGEPLLKSRSLVHVVGRRNVFEEEERRKVKGKGKGKEKEEMERGKEKKATRFWSKFLKGGSKRVEKGEKSWKLAHSRTLKEKPSAKWVPFV